MSGMVTGNKALNIHRLTLSLNLSKFMAKYDQ
jgi:hypothetical protein